MRGFWRVVAGILYDVQFDDLLEQSKAPTGEPSGAGEQVKAINFASAAPSKIRGRAEFGLCLRFSAPSFLDEATAEAADIVELVSSVS